MRLLANENVPRATVDALRAMGHDVAWIAESSPSVRDADVLAAAIAESRVLLTQDKDFGELAFRHRLPAACGVVLFRVPPRPEIVTRYAREVLTLDADYRGRFVVVEETRIRDRPLPR